MNVPNYCKPCGEFLAPEQTECPFCARPATPVDELADAIADRNPKGGDVEQAPSSDESGGAGTAIARKAA